MIKSTLITALAATFMLGAMPAMACKGEDHAAANKQGSKTAAKGQDKQKEKQPDKQEKPAPVKEG